MLERELVSSKAVSVKSTEPPYTKQLADVLEVFLEAQLAQAQHKRICCFWNGGVTWHVVGFSAEQQHQQKQPSSAPI